MSYDDGRRPPMQRPQGYQPRPQQRPQQRPVQGQQRPQQRPAAAPGRSPRSDLYQPRAAGSVRARAERQGGNFETIFKPGFDSWKPKAGFNTIRFLPPTWPDQNHFG